MKSNGGPGKVVAVVWRACFRRIGRRLHGRGGWAFGPRPVRLASGLGLLLAWAAVAWVGCGDSSNPREAGLQKVRLQLNWVPEAEHGGYYAALVHGYYRQMGLDVEIIPGGVSAPVLQPLTMGRVEFGVVNSDWVMLGRNDGARVKVLMAPIQNSPRCILVRPELGVRSFSELSQLTLAASPNSPFLAFMQRELPLEGVSIVPYHSMQAFFSNPNYAQQGYSFSEPYLAGKQGIEATVLMVSDLGFNPYTSCLVADESLIQADPALVRRFVQASIRGWERYLTDPLQTNQRIAQLNPDQDLASLNFALDEIRRLCGWDVEAKRAAVPIGSLQRDRFQQLGEQLQATSLISRDDARVYSEAYTLEFLPVQSADPPSEGGEGQASEPPLSEEESGG